MARKPPKKAKPRCRRPPKRSKAAPHPWRLCPSGEHWVSEHPRRVKVSKKNPTGITSVEGHCRANRSHKDEIYEQEMHEIAGQNFSSLNGPPKTDDLGFDDGNKYDSLIRGWTKYWNDIFKPAEPLDPDMVKALIATESSFNAGSKIGKGDVARGLMQVRDTTLKILSDECGELRDHLLNVGQKDANDPNLNIAAGTRWLFRKRETATARLKRQASWEEAVEEYKAYLQKRLSGKKYNKKPMDDLREYYRRLKK